MADTNSSTYRVFTKKFTLVLFIAVANTALLAFKSIDMVGYTTLILPLVGAFMTADVVEKFKLESPAK